MTEKLEHIQNSVLRIIFKTNLSDQNSSESLRNKSKVETIKDTQGKLIKTYFSKAISNQNKYVLKKLFLILVTSLIMKKLKIEKLNF